MAPFNALTLLSALLALTATTHAQTGTISGFPIPPIKTGAPFPLSNATLPYGGPTATGGLVPSGGPVGTCTGTAVSTGFAMPTAYGAKGKRYEMRGLKEERKEQRWVFWG